ncbi:MAG: ABC transporter substrate-binding protein [Clostridiales bacterium]|jgi:peptide/nickel transport system substrate-binding protein|nr:ABC transporter substrate-binding protein [Clostridiales bacterium]
MNKQQVTALLLAALMAGLTACGNSNNQNPPASESAAVQESAAPSETAAETPASATAEPAAEAAVNRPLVIATSDMNGKFSPFTYESAYDNEIVEMVLGEALIMNDRLGELVYNGIEGETRSYNGTDYFYNGLADGEVVRDEAADTTIYRLKLREGVTFSDGEELNIDDIIFTMYAYVDPSYTGNSTLYSVPIQGLAEYRQGYENAASSFQASIDAIVAAGPDGASESANYTADMFAQFWEGYNANLKSSLEALVAYVNSAYASAVEDIKPGATDLDSNAGLQIALGMYGWGFADPGEGGGITDAAGTVFDLESTYPTIDDYIASVNAKYETGYQGASEAGEFDGVPGAKSYATFVSEIINEMVLENPDMVTRGVTSISGIKRVSDYELEIVVNGYDSSAVFKLFQFYPAPLHYYGDESKYDFDGGTFGFDYGDTAFFSDTETNPMGAGPYKFVKYENKIVYLEANENYWKGAPLIKEVQYRVTSDSDNIPAIQTGTVDIANVSMNTARADQIKQVNNGDLSGDVITYSAVKNLGYGYIGLNAKNVSVNGERSSDASKNLRKGIATIFAAFRDMTVSTYYGELANVINYPMSETSWAAPQRTDAGYTVAYSKDISGNDIYTSSMSETEREEAAKQAALGFFEAAGYTVADGKVTAAPANGRTTFEVWIPAGGEGDHPSFLLLTKSKEALESIGITLNIRDLPSQSTGDLWDGLDAETVDMWCAAWEATLDPDIYQLYHSDGLVGTGTGANHYGVDDPALDEAIAATRVNPNNDERKVLFMEAFNVILDQGVEVPVYQRDNCYIFSTQRIDVSTLPGDMTTYYQFTMGIEKIALK